MAGKYGNFVQPEELELFVNSIREHALKDVGSKRWLDSHEVIIKLGQQAILEASEHRSENVSEYVTLNSKLKVLVHEAYCIVIWKKHILPKLLVIEPNPKATFLIYTTLFHEAAAVTLLDAAIFYHDACASLGDSSLDLIDYCAQSLLRLLNLVNDDTQNLEKIDVEEASSTEMTRQRRDIEFKIGLRCLSILNYIVQYIDRLPLSASRRLVVTHDIPWLVIEILHCQPWFRKTKRGIEKFIDNTWVNVSQDQMGGVIKEEAQIWFSLSQLLSTESIMQCYPLNEARRNQLLKCQGLLHDSLLLQIPQLKELKQFLCTLPAIGDAKANQPLLLEEIPEVKDGIIAEAMAYGGYDKIAAEQAEIYLTDNHNDLYNMASRLNSAYNTDLLAEIESKKSAKVSPNNDFFCVYCNKPAEKKCGNCKAVYYCSRECQTTNWAVHKTTCLKDK